MNAQPILAEPEEHPAILKAIRIVGSERKLARALAVSRTLLYLVRLQRERCSAELAVKINHVTGNKVRKHELRPDLWTKRER